MDESPSEPPFSLQVMAAVESQIRFLPSDEAARYAAMALEEKREYTHALARKMKPAIEARAAEYEVQQASAARERLRSDLAGMRIPERLLDRLVDGGFDEDSPAALACRRAITEGKRIVVLSGPPGCGKTTAACIAVKRMESSSLFLSAWARSRASFFDSNETAFWVMAPVLVIDDVGEEYADAKGFSASVLDQLVNERYDHDDVTIITTNLPAARFKERCGERIADRIREVGAYIELAENSMRMKPDGGETNSG